MSQAYIVLTGLLVFAPHVGIFNPGMTVYLPYTPAKVVDGHEIPQHYAELRIEAQSCDGCKSSPQATGTSGVFRWVEKVDGKDLDIVGSSVLGWSKEHAGSSGHGLPKSSNEGKDFSWVPVMSQVTDKTAHL